MALKLPRDWHQIDIILRNVTVGVIVLYVFLYGSVFEQHYPQRLVELYERPWWRLAIVGLVALGSWWCPRVGLVLGIAVYLYLNDMYLLTNPFTNVPQV